MKFSSLRILLFALALVAQTVAGGMSLAQATASVDSPTISHHCEDMSALDDGAPADHVAQHGICEHCLLCAGPFNVAVDLRNDFLFVRRSVSTIGFSATPAGPLVLRVATARGARGPPSRS